MKVRWEFGRQGDKGHGAEGGNLGGKETRDMGLNVYRSTGQLLA